VQYSELVVVRRLVYGWTGIDGIDVIAAYRFGLTFTFMERGVAEWV